MTVYRRPDPIPMHRAHPAAAVTLGQIRPDQEDLHHLVARRIFLAIAGGSYPEGSILPTEQALADELGVSRTALREAIKGLASKGLLETRRRRGTMVLERSHWNMLDTEVIDWLRRDESASVSLELWESVTALLPQLARLSARRGAMAPLSQARLVLGATDVEARADFLAAIARLSGNRFALSMVARALQNLLARDRQFLDRATAGLTPSVAREIVAQLRDGKADRLDSSLAAERATETA